NRPVNYSNAECRMRKAKSGGGSGFAQIERQQRAYARRHILFDFQPRLADGAGKSDRVGIAMRLDDGALQADERRAVVLARVDALAEGLENGPGANRGGAAEQSARKFLTQILRDQLAQPLAGLERNIADKTVAHHDVDVTDVNVVTFDEADV